MLYPKQAQTVDNLYHIYQQPNHISQGHLFISGEMGVGKTYMASALINKLQAKKTLIACPVSVAKKWQKVAQEYNPDKTISIYNPKQNADLTDIVIVKQKDLYKFALKYLLTDIDDNKNTHQANYNAAENAFEEYKTEISRGAKRIYNKVVSVDNYFAPEMIKQIFDFAIIDEIHLYQPTHQDFAVVALLAQMKIKMLNLTGTIFNQNVAKLILLLMYTNRYLMKASCDLDASADDYDIASSKHKCMDASWFYLNIWRYLGSQISLKDIEKKRDSTDKINQTTMPLEGLNLTDEQKAWQTIAELQLNHLQITKNRQDLLITSYLDLPSRSQLSITKHHNIDSNIFELRKNFISMQLTPIEIQNTAKFKQLKSILQSNPAKTLIFVLDNELLKRLPQVLPNTASLAKSVKKEKVADQLNELFTKYNNVVVTIKQVSVGIDVNNAQNVIWYQVPNDIASIIQANRRVLRLNSTTPSKVWYLYYKETHQEEIITEVSKSAVNNAAAYSSRLDDNLARATQVLFGNLN